MAAVFQEIAAARTPEDAVEIYSRHCRAVIRQALDSEDGASPFPECKAAMGHLIDAFARHGWPANYSIPSPKALMSMIALEIIDEATE